MRSSLHTFLAFITDIGDSACLVALAAAASCYLLSRGSKRAVAFLITSLLLSAFLIALFKLLFLGCHSRFHAFDVHSPSGHACISAAVFWAVSSLMRSQLEVNRRFLPLLAMTVLIFLIAVSRVWLQYHTMPEVCIGLITGYVSLVLARFLILRNRGLVPFDAYVLALWCIGAVFLAHGLHLPVEEWLHSIASHLHKHVAFCSVTS